MTPFLTQGGGDKRYGPSHALDVSLKHSQLAATNGGKVTSCDN